MSGTALVLAAHGSHTEPAVENEVRTLTTLVAERTDFDEVVAAFHQGRPGFSEVLDELGADRVVVVPLMTSEGYYSRVVLPRELARNRRFYDMPVTITPPVGAHSRMAELVASRAMQLIDELALDPARTTLAIVGHGTKRHADSGSTTIRIADELNRSELCGQVLHAFLDEDPLVETIVERTTGSALVVLPFLIARGSHAVRDLPERLDRGDRRYGLKVVTAPPVGLEPGIVDFVVDLARSAVGCDRVMVP